MDHFAPPLVSPEYFKSQPLRVTLTGATQAQKFELLELQDEILTLDIPKKFSSPGHHTIITIELGNKIRFKATAKILSVESTDQERDRAQVQIVQYDKKTWRQLNSLLAQRQHRIGDFMREIKGY
jgi:hypothetical protein